ncbi:MAG TPA: hypothetical protein VHQ47_00285 [Phycisphaerae bacterium]|nr:hypothetical protein [Phycisphaerae bacterium]
MWKGALVLGAVVGMAAVCFGQTKWDGIVKGLSSADFSEREAAARTLENATWRDLPALRAMAAGADDTEVKARFANRVEELELEGLIHPRPISLDVKNANITDLCAALSQATGVQITPWTRGPQGGPWTEHAVDKPFWEVFADLEKQSMLHIQNAGDTIEVAAGPERTGGTGPIQGDWTEKAVGDFLFHVGMGRQPNAARPGEMLAFGMRGDPRVRLVRCDLPEILSVVDDQGNVLYNAVPRRASMGTAENMPEVNLATGFPAPDGKNRKVTITGQMRVLEATAVEKTPVTLAMQPGDPVVIGGRTWRLWAIPPLRDEGWIINVAQGNRGVASSDVPLAIRVVDSAGAEVWNATLDGQQHAQVHPATAKPPLTAELTAATVMKEEVVKFEFKDVPVPDAGDPFR